MHNPHQSLDSGQGVLRFGVFELDTGAGELRKAGLLVRLQPQPLKVLAMLASRSGQVVSREDLKRSIWGEETFVDFERGLNFCIGQVRTALGDAADSSRFIQTLPRRGYRFIAPVEMIGGRSAAAGIIETTASPAGAPPATAPSRSARTMPRYRWGLAALGLVLAIAAGLIAWRWRTTGSSSPARVMMAVLPFSDLGGQAADEYLSQGLTEEIITQLGRIEPGRLGVIARTSVARYRSGAANIAQIGSELGVEYVLEGSVRRDANAVRITAQLIRVRDQTHLWAESYDRPIDATLDVQAEVASRVADALSLRLLPSSGPSIQPLTRNAAAYDAYLKGRYLANKGSADELGRAAAYFEQAVERDPSFAAAHASLADVYHLLVMTGAVSPRDAYPKARAAASRAVALQESLAEGHAALGSIAFWYDWDPSAAGRSFQRALALNGSLAAAHHDYGWSLIALDRFDEGLSEIRRAQALDPLSPRANIDVGWALIRTGRYDEAIAQSRRTLELEPDFLEAEACLERAYLLKGMPREALDAARVAMTRSDLPTPAVDESNPVAALDRLARLRLERLEGARSTRYVSPYSLAAQHAAVGDTDAALTWLERAFDDRSVMLGMLRLDPAFAGLRNQPRFASLLKRIATPGPPTP